MVSVSAERGTENRIKGPFGVEIRDVKVRLHFFNVAVGCSV